MTTDVTIVVATRNRREQFLALLPRHTAPVIVVDNGSEDGTPAAVAREFPRARVVELGRNAGAGAARNVGVGLARTPYVAFADDDSYRAPGVLGPLGAEPDAPGPTVLGFLACAVVLRRDAYRQVGGFAERLGTYGEEALLAMDLAAAGWNLAYVPELVAHHLPVPAGRDPGARRRAEARNPVLTAALRRPGSV
ncbi:glycosyltransferase, partial [Micromonospora sp. MH33]|uniref:glycosyltransferase family 2 protein n=1 Tax=Micromonospora sp. MH33 TaxID=1945509 RepID=UPI000D14A094